MPDFEQWRGCRSLPICHWQAADVTRCGASVAFPVAVAIGTFAAVLLQKP